MACMNAHGLSNSLLISSIRIRKSIFQSRKTQTNGGDWCQIYIKPNICSICIPPHPFKKRKKKDYNHQNMILDTRTLNLIN